MSLGSWLYVVGISRCLEQDIYLVKIKQDFCRTVYGLMYEISDMFNINWMYHSNSDFRAVVTYVRTCKFGKLDIQTCESANSRKNFWQFESDRTNRARFGNVTEIFHDKFLKTNKCERDNFDRFKFGVTGFKLKWHDICVNIFIEASFTQGIIFTEGLKHCVQLLKSRRLCKTMCLFSAHSKLQPVINLVSVC